MDRADAEAADWIVRRRCSARRATPARRPDGDEGCERLVVETGEAAKRRRERGAVQPLHIVDRHAEPAGGGEQPHRAQKRRRHTRSSAGGADSPRRGGLERPPLHRRQLRDDLAGRGRASPPALRTKTASPPPMAAPTDPEAARRAASIAASHSVVFPIPASPNGRSGSCSASSRRRTTAPCSSSRPNSCRTVTFISRVFKRGGAGQNLRFSAFAAVGPAGS